MSGFLRVGRGWDEYNILFHEIDSDARESDAYNMQCILYIIIITIIIKRQDWWLSRKYPAGFRPLLYHDVDESSASDFANRLGEDINNTYIYTVIELLADFNIDRPNGVPYWNYNKLCLSFMDINLLLL